MQDTAGSPTGGDGTLMALSIDEIVQRRAYNAAADLVDGNVARGLGDKVAFTDPERSLTYGELQARSFSSPAR